MIKIWILVTMISVQGWPTVKTNQEVWFDKVTCEINKIQRIKMLETIAFEEGIETFWIDGWCIETNMFDIRPQS